MVDIASRSRYATTGLVYDLHHIAISVLHQIREEHRIAEYYQEASTSHGPSIRPPVSSIPVHMQPIRGRGVIFTLKLSGWPTNLVFSQLKEYPISLNCYEDIYR